MLWLAISFQMARAQQNGRGFTKFQAGHVLSSSYTGPANKDLGNVEMLSGFVSYYNFDRAPSSSDYNSEMHIHDTVLEFVGVAVYKWAKQYLSCCPPYSGTNSGNYYRCNTWTSEANDNCHTPNLPWNDGQIMEVGAQVPDGAPKIGGKKQWMYSFPAEGEGNHWWQGTARRIKMESLAWFWVDQAGGCDSGWHNCQGKDIEDPCYGKCITANLDNTDLVALTEQALGDLQGFPNYGIDAPDVQGILYDGSSQPGTAKCLELCAGDSAYSTGIDLWDCNGLVNQVWTWNGDDLMIKLAGHNEPGMCIDVPGGEAKNGNQLWIWGCNGQDSQQWLWDSNTQSIRTALDWNYCIDLPGDDPTNGNLLWLWECNGGSSQKWKLYRGLGVDSPSNRSRNVTNKTAGATSWMHNIKKRLADSNYTRPTDWVPWYEKKEYKDWYAAQLPGPGLPRHMVPEGWKGYNSTRTLLPKATVLV